MRTPSTARSAGYRSDTARRNCHGTGSENKRHSGAEGHRRPLQGDILLERLAVYKVDDPPLVPALLKPIHKTIRELTVVKLSFRKHTGTLAHGD